MDAALPLSDPALARRAEALSRVLGQEAVDDFLSAAAAVGGSYLPGDEDLVFGFMQRVLTRLKQAGRNRGLLFPKRDAAFRRMFDYMDAEGGIWVLHPGDGTGQVPSLPGWFFEHDAGDPERRYFGLTPGAAHAITLAFLEALAVLQSRNEAPPGGGASCDRSQA